MKHAYWIGGGSGAGKSTIARHLAARFGLGTHATDESMARHSEQSTRAECPLLHDFRAMDMDQRWVSRTPQQMLQTFPWFQGEAFAMIVDDIAQMPTDRGVVVEGFRLLPHLVQPLLPSPHHAVWLLPSPRFRQAVFESRGGLEWGFIAKTSDPEQALHNLLERDAMFTEHLAREARRLGLNVMDVDLEMREDELVSKVAALFRL